LINPHCIGNNYLCAAEVAPQTQATRIRAQVTVGENAVPLPHELSDDIVPDSTAVVGDIESFIAYIEYGHAWQDWCGRVQQCVRWIAQDFGPVSDDIVQDLLQKP
jgi:hypothetical protein